MAKEKYKATRDFSGGSVTNKNYFKGKEYTLEGDFVSSWLAHGWIVPAKEKEGEAKKK